MGSISINPNYFGSAGISFPSGNLKFDSISSITFSNLGHEWLHVGQFHITGVNFGDFTSRGMAEFEAYLFMDIFRTVQANGNTSDATALRGSYNHILEESYSNWLKALTVNGTTYPTYINPQAFRYWADKFGDVNITYNKNKGYVYDHPTYSPTTLSTIFNNYDPNCNL